MQRRTLLKVLGASLALSRKPAFASSVPNLSITLA